MSVSAVQCWEYNSENACDADDCIWVATEYGNYCDSAQCWNADGTDQSTCENFGLVNGGFECTWDAAGGESGYCNPTSNGEFFGDECGDFNGDQEACPNFCVWNAATQACNEPEGGFDEGGPAGSSVVSCGIISHSDLCGNIDGCTWSNNQCSGNADGMSCSDVTDRDMCTSFTLLSTCCRWDDGACAASFDTACYNSIPAPPEGANYCEDIAAYSDESVCNQISNDPWYMPCVWDGQHCTLNGAGLGDFSSVADADSEVICEAMGNEWREEEWTDANGNTFTDTWCELDYSYESGNNFNCDASCWACEQNANSATEAQNNCQASALGYCSFVADSNAFNGYGWCEQSEESMGFGSCDSDCQACEFITGSNGPQAFCENSPNNCQWIDDSSAPNGFGTCSEEGARTCANDCWNCYHEGACQDIGKGGSNACIWDDANYYCKPAGFSGEVCFNNLDDDGDGLIDCEDSNCFTNTCS